ncbi:hypothetical protein RND71_017925 [Anisodus tanguticus]|uniref:Uncharacterized protein n=1 Tax=Anisodus tanguticus TaxID=243964 RepID=A0AAE1S1J5_9SOLA|nr:hypothetical protein RND71_017925 [Anisodus tanguticus]
MFLFLGIIYLGRTLYYYWYSDPPRAQESGHQKSTWNWTTLLRTRTGIPPMFPHFVSIIPSVHSIIDPVSIISIPISKVAIEERFLFRHVEPREYKEIQLKTKEEIKEKTRRALARERLTYLKLTWCSLLALNLSLSWSFFRKGRLGLDFQLVNVPPSIFAKEE